MYTLFIFLLTRLFSGEHNYQVGWVGPPFLQIIDEKLSFVYVCIIL
jgi:hypothetical protein